MPAAYWSQTCSRCGHIDPKNRNRKDLKSSCAWTAPMSTTPMRTGHATSGNAPPKSSCYAPQGTTQPRRSSCCRRTSSLTPSTTRRRQNPVRGELRDIPYPQSRKKRKRKQRRKNPMIGLKGRTGNIIRIGFAACALGVAAQTIAQPQCGAIIDEKMRNGTRTSWVRDRDTNRIGSRNARQKDRGNALEGRNNLDNAQWREQGRENTGVQRRKENRTRAEQRTRRKKHADRTRNRRGRQ